MRAKDITGKRFGRLIAKYPTDQRKNGRIVWHCICDCGNEINVPSSYLTNEDTQSCGCLKIEKAKENYDPSSLFLGKEPRKDSSTGYRGVSRYYTRKSKEERYRAWITVKGKRYFKSGFLTPSEAYYRGRLELEKKYLSKNNPPTRFE